MPVARAPGGTEGDLTALYLRLYSLFTCSIFLMYYKYNNYLNYYIILKETERRGRADNLYAFPPQQRPRIHRPAQQRPAEFRV